MKIKDLLNKNYIYYCECMIPHTIKYEKTMEKIIGLDIRIKPLNEEESPKFLLYDEKVAEFKRLGIPVAYLKWRGKAEDVNEELLNELIKKSYYYEGLPEGVVIKNYERTNQYGRQIFGKVVNDNFSEHSKSRTNKIRPTDDTNLIVEEFVVPARVDKMILKMTTEGGLELNKELMKYLPVNIIKDIFKEEFEWILKNVKSVNIPSLKASVSKKCILFLNDFINRQLVKDDVNE